ncbi:unnamed protein product [Linum trigynum]|uniref:Uncharacterized protein n=1 Tax=Linum trigynum TaxID=586398 RepID=A0AAV2D180_9ROSI
MVLSLLSKSQRDLASSPLAKRTSAQFPTISLRNKEHNDDKLILLNNSSLPYGVYILFRLVQFTPVDAC